jgi:hypothetical protein
LWSPDIPIHPDVDKNHIRQNFYDDVGANLCVRPEYVRSQILSELGFSGLKN